MAIGEALAFVQKRHGAWLVALTLNSTTAELANEEAVDCAATLKLAKRVAESMADACGFIEPYTWDRNSGGAYILFGSIPTDDEATS